MKINESVLNQNKKEVTSLFVFFLLYILFKQAKYTKTMSYEWLNGVDSSVNFGSQSNQNYNLNDQHNEMLSTYSSYGNGMNFPQGNNANGNQMPMLNNNSGRPLPSIPNNGNSQGGMNPYMQNFQQPMYTSNSRPLPSLPQQQPMLNGNNRPLHEIPQHQPLAATTNLNQQFSGNEHQNSNYLSRDSTLNQQFSGSSFQQPNYTNNEVKNNAFFLNNFSPIQNNFTETRNRVNSNAGLQDFESIYGTGEISSGISNNSSFINNMNDQLPHANVNTNTRFQAKPVESFTPNYDNIDYNNAVSIFGKTKDNYKKADGLGAAMTQGSNAIGTQTRPQRSSTNPFRNMQSASSATSLPVLSNATASNPKVSLPPPGIQDFEALVQRIPKSLGKDVLSKEELKNYSRWFNDIIAKKKHSGETIRLIDVFNFLHTNFRVSDEIKQKIFLIFKDIKQNIGLDNFFVVLRCLVLLINENGKLPTRQLLMERALPTLKPRSILANNADKEEVYEEVTDDTNPGQLDYDNFASLLMTGKSHRVKRVVMRNGNRVQNKSVKFSDKLVTYEDEEPVYDDKEEDLQPTTKFDFSMPMDQLMEQMTSQKYGQSYKEDEAELADMKESLTHFQNLPKVDNVSLSMTGALPHMNFQQQSANNVLQPLRPTATGSANHMMSHQSTNPPQYLQPTATGSANHLFSSGRQPTNMFNTSFGAVSMPNGGLNDLKSIQDQIDYISAQMTGGNGHVM